MCVNRQTTQRSKLSWTRNTGPAGRRVHAPPLSVSATKHHHHDCASPQQLSSRVATTANSWPQGMERHFDPANRPAARRARSIRGGGGGGGGGGAMLPKPVMKRGMTAMVNPCRVPFGHVVCAYRDTSTCAIHSVSLPAWYSTAILSAVNDNCGKCFNVKREF